ncbi:hypothetical protein [Parvibaculum sedimenti]|uniref:hypothetical protein n=1 Tax=Parvibaculum sedimenti TaxID=2608632 RepID=UPI003BB552AC
MGASHENPLSVLEPALRAIRGVLAAATADERETLTMKSPLAWRIGAAILSSVECSSVERDVKLAELMFAAANLCSDEHERDLDMALTIAARCLLWRAFEIEAESDGLGAAITRMDVFISLVDRKWLTDHAELMAHLHRLRSHLVRFLDVRSKEPSAPTGGGRRDSARQKVFEIITGGRDLDGDGGRGKR